MTKPMNNTFTAAELDAYGARLDANQLKVMRAALVEPGYTAIGKRCKLKLGTVKSRLHRGRAALAVLKATPAGAP